MKSKWILTAAASAAMLFVAGCGGGGGGGASAPAAPSVSLSGTAATGLALASGKVTVKCAKGEGTSTTDASGKYSLVITDAALPCMIQVTGEAGGTTVTLHSVAQGGTANGANTAAIANVTPLTEMIVAQLHGALPSEIFSSFGSASQVTTEQLNAATSAVITALKDATGIDLTAIDPFKSSLVAATSSAPDAGNNYDKLLDALGEKVPPQALEQVVNQIANAAGTSGTGPVTLKEVMAAVDAGSLANCPTAVSGKYRWLAFWGKTSVWNLDFKAMTMTSANGATQLAITPDSGQACQFTATNGTTTKLQVAMGASGVAGVRDENLATPNTGMPGYLFPVQAQNFASLVGEWTFLQSGWMGSSDGWDHAGGRITIAADRTAKVCDFNSSFQCGADHITRTLADRTDGGFDWIEAGQPNDNFYLYRAPNGSLTLFGTTNPSGDRAPTTEQTSILAFKPSKLTLPAVDSVSKYWDINYSRAGMTNNLDPMSLDTTTVLSVDAAAQSVVRQRARDGRQDKVVWNHPLDGMRYRAAGSSPSNTGGTINFRGAYMIPLPGLGITVSFNSTPPVDPTNPTGSEYFFSISVNRP